MSTNYSKGKPVGDNLVPQYDSPPAVKALVTTLKEAATTTSSILILGQNTTAIEVSPTGGPAFIRWLSQATVDSSVAATSVITTGATVAFDHVIPAATVRRFVVPISIIPVSLQSVQGLNPLNGLFTHVAYSGTVTSVIAITQYGSANSY